MKINELAMYDCGLSDWVLALKTGAPRSSSSRSLDSASAAASRATPTQPRHTSRASISSEATFPLRPDAYVATDLSPRPSDAMQSPGVPPPLPYPALASVTPALSSNNRLSFVTSNAARSLPISSGRAANTGGGFFSSLGRSYSLKKDGRAGPPARLTKAPPSPLSAKSRTLQPATPPSVPGGPRAAPGRITRSQTLMIPPSPASSELTSSSPISPQARRRSNTLKRPSLFGHRPPNSALAISPDDAALQADFQQQVDKLAEVIPHADRDVLAGYLRRSGQDILAIGQYLEDAKNGTLRHD